MNKLIKSAFNNIYIKFLFVGILLCFGFVNAQSAAIANSSDTDSTWDCATCAGPSDNMKTFRKFLNDSMDAISLKKAKPIVGSDYVLWILKNADSNMKNINYNIRYGTKKSFRVSLYDGEDTVMWMADYAKDLLKFGNSTRLKELQTMDKYSDWIDQLAIKLIQSNQFNTDITDKDIAALQKVLGKYSNWSTKIFAASIVDEVKWKTYSDYMRFLLNVNEKMQFFVINGTLKTINTDELSLDTDLSAARDDKFKEQLIKDYSCSRVLHACDKIQEQLNNISKNFSINTKYQKWQIQIAVNWLKDAMSRFNSVVLGVQDEEFNADYSDEANQKFLIKKPTNDEYNERTYGTVYQWWNADGWFFGKHFQVNKQIDSKITNMISTKQETNNKLKNTDTSTQIKNEITKQEQENTNNIIQDYQVSVNNRQENFASNNLALAKTDMNNFVNDAMIMQDKYSDKNILSESESVTKLFPNLSKAVYVNINNIWDRSDDTSCLTNFVDMCNYQCANLWWKCEPALN